MLKSRNSAHFSAGTKLSGLVQDGQPSNNEQFSTAERSERVENLLFRATREYTEASLDPRPSSPPDLRPSGRGPGKTAILFRVFTHKSG